MPALAATIGNPEPYISNPSWNVDVIDVVFSPYIAFISIFELLTGQFVYCVFAVVYFTETEGMIIIKVSIVEIHEPNNDEHYEYDLYMHTIVNSDIENGNYMSAGQEIGTVSEEQAHLHFSRLEYFVDKYNAPKLVSYDYAGKNVMNPLSNFSTNEYKDPNTNSPSIEKYTNEPSFLYKRNLYGNHYRLTQ